MSAIATFRKRAVLARTRKRRRRDVIAENVALIEDFKRLVKRIPPALRADFETAAIRLHEETKGGPSRVFRARMRQFIDGWMVVAR